MAGWLGGWLVGWLASWLLENNVATDFPENTSNAVLPIPRSSHSRPTQAFEALGEAHALTRYQQREQQPRTPTLRWFRQAWGKTVGLPMLAWGT